MSFATKSFVLTIKQLSETGVFEGYASTFGNLDDGGDIVEPGAFTKTLAKHKREKTVPLMLWQHNTDDPIGVWDQIEEDDKGLWSKGQLLLDVQSGKEAYSRLKAGAVRGLSIGYNLIKATPEGNNRRLIEVNLEEISIVSFAMNRRARVEAVKSSARFDEFARRLRDGEPMPIKEFEDILHDAGIPKAMATRIASVGYAKAIRSESEGMNEKAISALTAAARTLISQT
jgi:HK97 family phage prohead protease